MKLLELIVEISSKMVEIISVVLLLLMIVITCLQVFLRYVLNNPTSWSGEVAIILLIWLGYLGIALGIKDKEHISIDYLYAKLNEKYRKALDCFFYVAVILFSILMIVNGRLLVGVTTMQKLPATGLSKAILYSALIVSGVLMILYSFRNICTIYLSKQKSSK